MAKYRLKIEGIDDVELTPRLGRVDIYYNTDTNAVEVNTHTEQGVVTEAEPDLSLGTTPDDGDVLTYDAESGKWLNATPSIPSLENIGDIDFETLTNGDVLIYNAATQKWENKTNDNMALSGLDDVLLTDISDKQILQYDVTSEEWHNTSNVVLGLNSTATEINYEAGAPVEIIGLSSGKVLIEQTGSQLRLIHVNIPDGYTKWDSTNLVFGAELIDSTLKYRFQIESLTLENENQSQVLTINAMSEAEAYAYMLSVANNDDYFGLALSVPVTTNHTNSIILSDNIIATDDNTIYADNLIVNDSISTIDKFIKLGENSTATETTYVAGISVELQEPGNVQKHTTSRNGLELTLTYYGEQLQFPQFGFETFITWYNALKAGTYLIDSTLTYTLEVVSVNGGVGSSTLVVNAASEAEAIAFESLHPTGPNGTYGLYVKAESETSHANTIIIGDNITATADNNIFFEKGQIGEHIIEEMYSVGDVIEDGTNVWDMFEETGGMYIEYKGLPSSFPQFVENNYIAYNRVDPFTQQVLGEYFLKILSITQESASTSGDYTGDMTFLHCEIITGTFQEIYDNSTWIAYSATYTPGSTHTAINIGTGNTISHNNSHIIGNDITTDAEDTLYVNNLNVSGDISVTDKLSQGTAVSYLPNMFSKSDIGNLGKYCNITIQCQTNDDTKQNFTIGDTAGLIVIPTNTIYNFRVLGVGADASGNTATYEIKGTAKNIAGTVTVANVTATEITDDFTITGMSAEADDTNNALVITATGKAATTINWSAFVEWQEFTFA